MPEKTIEPFTDVNDAKLMSRGEEESGFKAVQDYLERFGYLQPGAYNEDQLDDATSEALTLFQQQHSLKTTGVFDTETRDQMTTHRCGMPDLGPGVAFSVRCSWPTPNLTFAFEDGTNDIAGTGEFQAVRRAFATWAAAAPVTFVEVAANEHPDVMIDWRPANDPDHSMVGGVLAHADFPPGCGVVTNTLPKPVHFDDSEHLWVVGAAAGGFDVESVALHEIGHILGLQHSNVSGAVMFPSISDNSTNRVLRADDLSGIRQLYGGRLLAPGTYTVRQKSTGRFVDAHEIQDQDFRLVTRTAQNNDTQRWIFNQVGTVYSIRQLSSGRFVDAHEFAGEDFRVVTRTVQGNDTQRWVALSAPGGTVTLRQLSSGRFLDAHEIQDQDFRLVTRPEQNNDTQRWTLTQIGPNVFTIQQKSNGRFVDAHEHSGEDFRLVTRTAQNNATQRWIFNQVGTVFTIQQKSNNRFVDAHEHDGEDFRLVTRPAQNNDTQRWIVLPVGDGSFTIRQLSNRRFVDAHDHAGEDFRLVTRPDQNNDTQRWLFSRA